MNDLVVSLLALWLYGLDFSILIRALPRHRNSVRVYLAAQSWALGVALAFVCGLAIVSGALAGKFLTATGRSYNAISGAVFLALCATAIYFAIYLFSAQ